MLACRSGGAAPVVSCDQWCPWKEVLGAAAFAGALVITRSPPLPLQALGSAWVGELVRTAAAPE